MKLFKFLFGISICLFLSICIGTNAKNHNSAQEYFYYVDTQRKPRTLIVGCGWCREKDKDYFCLDICEEVNADYTCNIATKDSIGQWDYIVFEHLPVEEYQGNPGTRNGITNALKLLKIGGTISSHTFPSLPEDKERSDFLPILHIKYALQQRKDPRFHTTMLKLLGIPYPDKLRLSFECLPLVTPYDPRYHYSCLGNCMLLITKLANL